MKQTIINEIKEQAKLAISLDWGSEEQIQADTNVYIISADYFGIDWEEHDYLLKATTPEAMDYVLNIINRK